MKVLQLQNRQRARKLNLKAIRVAARRLLEDELRLTCYQLALHFVSARKMAEVNQQFLSHEGSTDVITFDLSSGYDLPVGDECQLQGEIFISPEDALQQSRQFRVDWREELARYIVHGVLHLRGYDDLTAPERRRMKKEENRVLEQLGKSVDFTSLGS